MFAVGEGSEAFLVNLLCEFNKISRWVPDTIQPTLSSRSAHGTCTAGFCFLYKKKIIEINKGTTLLQPKAKLTKKNLQKSTMSVRKKSNLFLHLCKEYNVLGSITFEYISGKKRRKSFYLGLSSVLSSSQTIYK